MALVHIGIRYKQEPSMTDVIAAENKALMRRFYKEVYIDWNLAQPSAPFPQEACPCSTGFALR
jgi:hypothetical protein